MNECSSLNWGEDRWALGTIYGVNFNIVGTRIFNYVTCLALWSYTIRLDLDSDPIISQAQTAVVDLIWKKKKNGRKKEKEQKHS